MAFRFRVGLEPATAAPEPPVVGLSRAAELPHR